MKVTKSTIKSEGLCYEYCTTLSSLLGEAAFQDSAILFIEFHVGQILGEPHVSKPRIFAVMAIFLLARGGVPGGVPFTSGKKDAPESIPFERDTFYRLNSCAIHWAQVHACPGTAIIQMVIATLM